MASLKLLETINVHTKNNQYPILIGQQLINRELLSTYLKSKKIFIVSDQNVAKLYLSKLIDVLGEAQVESIVIEAGEPNKSLTNWSTILSTLIEKKFNRDSLMIALGGGVVGDLAGFAASCFQRGIPFIQIPTTLLAQVDSSVGGKTAINFAGEKNVIGSFYQPQVVIIDLELLQTLADREYRAGLAEVIKYGLLGDAEFFEWLTQNSQAILSKEHTTLSYMIQRCCQMKADIVSLDETEQGKRALLNLGHTFGHALEAATAYQRWLHGEAVAIGLYCQALLAVKLGLLLASDIKQLINLLEKFGLAYQIPKDLNLSVVLDMMYRDKKVMNSSLRFIVNTAIGESCIQEVTDPKIIMQVLEDATNTFYF